MRESMLEKTGYSQSLPHPPQGFSMFFGTTGGGGKKKGYVGKDVRLVLVIGILVPACKYKIKI